MMMTKAVTRRKLVHLSEELCKHIDAYLLDPRIGRPRYGGLSQLTEQALWDYFRKEDIENTLNEVEKHD